MASTVQPIITEQPVINSDSTSPNRMPPAASHIVYVRRWFIIISVALLNASNALTWNSFASVAATTKEYYNIEFSDVNLLSIVFMVITIPVGFVAIWCLDAIGLRFSVIGAAFLNAAGPALRLLTTFDFVPGNAKFPVLMAGQCIAAISQAFILFCPPKIAQYWFPDNQRAIANTLGSMANPLGILLSAVLSPIILREPSDMLYLMITYTSPAVLALVVTIFSLTTSKPKTPPSKSANEISEPFLKGAKIIVKNKMFLLLMVCFGVGMGIFSAIIALIMQMLCPYGYDEIYAGATVGIMVGSGLIGAAISGIIVDATKLFVEVTKICYALAVVFIGVFGSVLVLPNQPFLLAVVIGLVGLFGFAQYPICLEMAVETTFPVAEATSAGLLVIFGQIMAAVFVLTMQPLGVEVVDKYRTCSPNTIQGGVVMSYVYGNILITSVACVAGIALILFYQCPYKRLQFEKIQSVKPAQPVVPSIQVATPPPVDNDSNQITLSDDEIVDF